MLRDICERCGGEFRAWDARPFTVQFVGGVRCSVCHACHNEIIKAISDHPRWKEVAENDALRAMPDTMTAAEMEAQSLRYQRKFNELNAFFHEFVLVLLPFQKRAADVPAEVGG